MSITMEEEIKRWTARRKSALVLEIIQGKTTVPKAIALVWSRMTMRSIGFVGGPLPVSLRLGNQSGWRLSRDGDRAFRRR